jgi:hypothetical protein
MNKKAISGFGIIVIAGLLILGWYLFVYKHPISIDTTQLEKNCNETGGKVVNSSCCKSVGDFPSNCNVGACGCSPSDSHEVKSCDCGPNKCFNGTLCMEIGMTPELCNSVGGNWNTCSSKCRINNQGKTGVSCPTLCEALCECGGIMGLKCPARYYCAAPTTISDAMGYCAGAVFGE